MKLSMISRVRRKRADGDDVYMMVIIIVVIERIGCIDHRPTPPESRPRER